jgi:4-amino-4-deoxy-L-arabinose transferase-like glycosyltransferase
MVSPHGAAAPNRHLPINRKRIGLEACVLGIVLLCVLVPIGKGFGVYWDTWIYHDRAMRWSDWFRSWTRPETLHEPLANLRYYFPPDQPRHPPLLEVGGGFLNALFRGSVGNVSSARVFVEVFAVLWSVASYLFLAPRVGRALALVGVLLYWGSPRFVVHAVLYAIDGLIAAVYGLALLSFLLWDRGWKGKALVFFTLLLGFLTKLQAYYLAPLLLLWIWLKRRERVADAQEVARRPTCRELGAHSPGKWVSGLPPWWKEWGVGAAIILLAVLAQFLLWPALWLDFPKGLTTYFDFITQHTNIPVLYFDTLYREDLMPPWHYPWVFTAIALPLSLTVPVVVRAVRKILTLLKRKAAAGASSEETLLWAGMLVPLLASSLPQAPKYDGVRLLLPAYGPLALLAALEIADWARRLASQKVIPLSTLIRFVLCFALAVLVLLPSLAMYPFNIVYYSPLIGGVRGAREAGFDLDYLGIAANRLNPTFQKEARPGYVLLSAGFNGLVDQRAADEWVPIPRNPAFLTPLRYVPGVREYLLEEMRTKDTRVFAIVSSRYSGLIEEAYRILEEIPPLDTVEFQGIRLFSLHRLPVEFIDSFPPGDHTLTAERYEEIKKRHKKM